MFAPNDCTLLHSDSPVADWVIDLGPEGGTGGGQVVAAGTPEEVAKVEGSWTGRYLKPLLT